MLLTRRELLARIGMTAGAGVMLNAMTAIGAAKASQYDGPIDLQGDTNGKSVVILGAGLAGMSAALELRQAGYDVTVLEYQQRSGGRCWSLRGGDKYTELGGEEQTVNFDDGLYINPGPWRIPYHHHAVLDYCRRLGVALQTFNQINFNAYLHSTEAFEGKPQRYRHVLADYNGQISELLAKATADGRLDDLVSNEDRDALIGSLDNWGALDADHAYVKSLLTSSRRGYDQPYGGGLGAAPSPSTPIELSKLTKSGLIPQLLNGFQVDYQHTIFEPIGGMDMIAKAFDREIGDLIEHGAKVTGVEQDESGVTINYLRTGSGETAQTKADYCICTLPLPILNQIELQASRELKEAIAQVPYAPSVKTGLQMKRRFWEEDEAIFGGISYTDLPITQISYPSTDYLSKGKGVLLGEYTFGPHAVRHTGLSAQERIKEAVKYGRQIHPQYDKEFENGVSVAWHRVPWAMGCYGIWTDERREKYYDTLCKFDGRVVLAGEHASYIPGWQEGSILSSLDATKRLHERAMQG